MNYSYTQANRGEITEAAHHFWELHPRNSLPKLQGEMCRLAGASGVLHGKKMETSKKDPRFLEMSCITAEIRSLLHELKNKRETLIQCTVEISDFVTLLESMREVANLAKMEQDNMNSVLLKGLIEKTQQQ